MSSRATAAPAPLTLKDESGKEHTFWVSPLTDHEMSMLDAWVQARVVSIARKSLTEDMTPAEREEVLSVAMRESLKYTFTSGVGAKLLASIDGMATVMHIACLKKHPDLDFEFVRRMLFLPGNLDELNRVTKKVNVGLEEPVKNDLGPVAEVIPNRAQRRKTAAVLRKKGR